MSMKRFGKAAYRIANELVSRSSLWSRLWPRMFPSSYNLGVHVVLNRAPFPIKQTTFKIGRLVTRNGRLFRPLSSLLIEKNKFDRNWINSKKFQPLKTLKRNDEDLIDRIKYLFGHSVRYNENLKKVEMPNRIDCYEFGEFLGKGCNAAVYAAKLTDSSEKQDLCSGFNEVSSILAEHPPVSRSEISFNKYPLAIKLMFNFEHDRDGEDHLWKSMGIELAPYPKADKLLQGKMGKFKPLPRKHPNIVRIATAFVDSLKILPDATERYPDALHTARWYESIAAQPKTMYIIMSRYRQTMHDYIWTHHRNYWTGRVLMGQLLEACTYLHENNVSQRDMKSDNILLHYDFDDEIPQLVIADFGCALATGEWDVTYNSKDVNLGGNIKTRAPEIVTAKPGPNVVVNFEMADTWAAGGLSYELLTRNNPFYKQIDSATYIESELPPLPSRVHFVARDVIRDLLKRDPKERVRPHIAANALNLSLFRLGEDVKQMMEKCGVSQLTTLLATSSNKLGKRVNSGLDKVMSLITAETIVANLAPQLISRAERQLRATFLSRIDREEIWKSLQYFFPPNHSYTIDTLDDGSIASLVSSFSESSDEPGSKNGRNQGYNVPLLRNVIRTDSSENGILQRVRSK